jgi:Leu/Phe-tRNA-protein transferase
MASIKNLKKDINYVLEDVIDECLSKLTNDTEKSEAIVDEAIAVFDDLMEKVNAKNVENKKAHFKGISTELESKAGELLDKINKL